MLIYSDPQDDGYFKGDAYPNGPWRPDTGVQRGSVQFLFQYPGDPETPGVASTLDLPDSARISPEGNQPHIISIPISYYDAAPILKALKGEGVPSGWQGALPFRYHLGQVGSPVDGQGAVKAHLVSQQDYQRRIIWDVIGEIPGSVYPDDWVIVGNHRDAWVYGAVDPNSGTAAMLESVHGIGALLLGYYADGELIYAGRAGTGFNEKTHKLLRDKLEPLKQASTPFEKPPAEARTGAYWVKPTLVAQVRFATWTADNLVRQAAFLGLRDDKPAAEVRRENSAPTPKFSKAAAPKAASHAALTHPVAAKRSPTDSVERTAKNEHPPVRLTHPAKVLDPESGLTKQALADYYWAVAARMLPHIAGRPLSLVRCPEGSASPCFFQKHVNATLPKGIGSVEVRDKKTGVIEPYITLDGKSATPEALASLAQLGVLEVHPWGSRNQDLEHPDRLIFDLDPDESLAWPVVAKAAAEVRARLKKLGLTSFLKTTGGKGLHVVIPIEPKLDWAAAKDFAHRFVLGMEKANPKLYLTKMTKAARTGKIYLDYLRNERGATAVAPYSPRARAGAGVSMPLAWAEIAASGEFAATRPSFRVAGFAKWRGRLSKDPWKALATTRQSLNNAVLSLLHSTPTKPRKIPTDHLITARRSPPVHACGSSGGRGGPG